jgi:hypothetical protein
MPAKKKLTPPANSRRNLWLRCRVNAEEAAAVIERINALDPQTAQIEGAQIAERLRTAAPFSGVGAFLRAVLGLPEIERGAPVGNSNRAGAKKRR